MALHGKVCPECHGSGEVELESGEMTGCERCNGEGYVEE